jgi:hypothetical protein
MGIYRGDLAEDGTLYFSWNTVDSNGASVTRSTDGTINVYKDDGTDGTNAGVTDSKDFNGIVGVHHCTIKAGSSAFYSTGSDYQVILEDGTIDSAAVNATIAEFSIENRFTDGTNANVTKNDGTTVSGFSQYKATGFSTYAPATDTFDGTETYEEHATKVHAALVNAVSGDGTNLTFNNIDGTALWTAALPGTTGTRTVS